MKKATAILALLFFVTGIFLAFSIQETRIEETVIDEWNPITPSTLYPQNVTGWAFMALTPNGTYLELNISASDDVRVIIGTLIFYDETTGKEIWNNVIFNKTGTTFTHRVEIDGENVDFLEIKNEGVNPVNIYGSIRKIGNVSRQFYPYAGLGTLATLSGLIMLIYGILTKPRTPKRPRRKRHKNLSIKL